MALNILVLLNVLTLVVTNPDPNVKVGVDLRVDNEGNGCCGGSKKSCNFGSITYPNKAILTMTCMEFQCIDGCWEYTDKFDNNCGNCTFGGEPVIYPFDTLSNTKPFEYDGNGTFVMTQPYFATPGPGPQIGHANFGVMGHFTKNQGLIDYCGAITSCVNGVTYYESGITVRMSLVNTGEEEPAYHVVYVNGKNVTIGNGPCKVNVFHGTGGAILVFKHDRIDGGGQKCISVIGTQGLAVALCSIDPSPSLPYGAESPYAFIYASPTLKATPSQMYGLCNQYTGSNVDCFTAQNGTCVDDWQCGSTDVPPLVSVPILCNDLAESWEVSPWP